MATRMAISAETPLTDLEFVAFDTETTGCAAATDRMVEIGAVRFRLGGEDLNYFEQLINPLRPIPSSVRAIHGIDDLQVRDCPDERGVLPSFLSFLGDPSRTVLMAHNARFDMAFLGTALRRCGLDAPAHVVIDTVRLARRRTGGLQSHSLSSLVRCFGVRCGPAHRGLSDSIALKQMFLNLVARPPALTTAGDLFALAPAWPFNNDTDRRERWTGRRSRRPFRSVARTDDRHAVSARGRFATEPPRDGDADTCSDHTPGLERAIAAGRSVTLVYEGGRSAGEPRSVTPLRLVVAMQVRYLIAFCHVDRKQKQYRLDRIREVTID